MLLQLPGKETCKSTNGPPPVSPYYSAHTLHSANELPEHNSDMSKQASRNRANQALEEGQVKIASGEQQSEREHDGEASGGKIRSFPFVPKLTSL